MGNECHFCRGIVSADEPGDILLEGHGDHRVCMHRRCAAGYDLVREVHGERASLEVTCPECGDVEVV